jgi:hypothetical protein
MEESLAMSGPANEQIVTPYPNPFASEFTLRISGAEGERAQVAVFSLTGHPIENLGEIKANADYPNIGATWPKGMYVVKVIRGDEVITQMVVKK